MTGRHLQKPHTGQAVKVLQKLEQKGEITARTAGKQIVYHTPQKPTDSITPESIALIKSEINEFQTQLSSIKAEEKKARASLSALKAKPRIAELQHDIQRLGCERDDMQARLTKLNGVPETTAMAIQITPEERSQLEQEWKIWYRQATIRRRICRKMWDRCSEVLPENTSVLELWVNIPPRLPYHQLFANILLTWLQESLGLEGALQ